MMREYIPELRSCLFHQTILRGSMCSRILGAFPRIVIFLFASLLVVGSNGCRPHSRHNPSVPSVPVISSWESPLHESAEAPLAVYQKRYSTVTDHSRFELHSQKPYQEVEIPLTLRSRHAYVQTKWAGRQIECMLDTGSSAIMWPQWLHLDAHQLDIRYIHQGTEGPGIHGEWVLSPKIEIGNLTLVNVPTEAMGVPRPPSTGADFLGSISTLQSALTRPILGWFAFLPGVVTIDYFHKRLLVRNRDYDVTRHSHARRALFIPYQQTSSGLIALPGTLEGHKAQFLLDTGADWQAVSSAFAHKNLSSLPIRASSTTYNGEKRKSKPFLASVAGDFGGLHFKALDFYIEERTGIADVLLGTPFFLKYRVTIDPFRKVVLLENNR